MPGKTGLLLGAGASYELGMPLVWDVTRQLRSFYNPRHLEQLNKYWTAGGGGYGDDVVAATSALLQRADMHYEQVLGFLQTEHRRLGQAQEDGKNFRGMYLRLVESVYALLGERQIKQTGYLSRALIPYEGLAGLAERSLPLYIFSLNHDLMVEVIADHLALPLADGFWPSKTLVIPNVDEGGSTRGQLVADVLAEDDLAQNNLHFLQQGERGINLLKLHGSLDTFAFRDRKDLCRLRPVPGAKFGRLEALRVANEELGFWTHGRRFRLPNEIVYTVSPGEPGFLRRTLLAGAQKFSKRYDQTLPHRMLELFSFRITTMNEIYIIGYSFGDHHVDRILREWLELLGHRRMIIVDPHRSNIPPHFGHLAPQISVRSKHATDFFAEYRHPPLTKSQRLETLLRRSLRSTLEASITRRIARQGAAA
jgi:hypothetical protein